MNLRRLNGKWGLVMLVVSALWLTGCSGPQGQGQFASLLGDQPAVAGAAAGNTGSEDYHIKIQPGEALSITFSDMPNTVPPFEQRVKEDGTISLLLNQTFVAAGKTRRELEAEIRDRYVPKYYVNMSVSVRQQENTRFFYVGGEVRTPGRQVYLGPMTVLKAIQSAGDFTDFAKRTKVQLTRANGKIETVNAKKALKDPNLDPAVYPGDRINVPRSIW